MELAATDSVNIDRACDAGVLPFYAQRRSIIACPSVGAVWSCDDLKGSFYLLRLPPAWAPPFAFDATPDPRALGLPGEWVGQ